MEDLTARAEKAVQQLREERLALEARIAEAHQAAQDLLAATKLARDEIRQSAKHEARKQLAGQLSRLAEQLRIKDA